MDSSRVGEVYRLLDEGLAADVIAERLEGGAAGAFLDAADHSRTVGKSAGREWFLTHTRFLDEIARTLGLRINVINQGEFDDN